MAVKPPVGAADPRVTVPVEVAPPSRLVGFSVTPVSEGLFTVNVAFSVVAARVAEMEANVWLATG